MASVPRPRVFITVLIWLMTCCGFIVIWQGPPPPPPPSSSLSFPSYASNYARDYFQPSSSNKHVSRTHVSNLLYLQPRVKQKTETLLTRSSEEALQNWATAVDGRTTSKTDPVHSIRSYLSSKFNPYPRISFGNKMQKVLGSSSTGYRWTKNPALLINDPVTSHKSKVWDATPTRSVDSVPYNEEDNHSLLEPHTKETSLYKDEKGIDFSKHSMSKSLLSTLSRSRNEVNTNSVYGSPKELTKSADIRAKDDERKQNTRNHLGYEDEYPRDYNEEQEVDLGGKYNVTPSDASLLVYNRIPKCASSTMQTLLRRLSHHLGFEHVSSLIYNQRQLTQDDQEKLVENLTTSVLAAPSHALSYDRHLYYTNFTGLGLNPPVYINVVRDPVERFISSFYYRRSEERLNRIQLHGHPVTPSSKWVNRTVEQCIMLSDPECSFTPGEEKEMILSYFCGHQEFCRIVGNRDALQVAKETVSKEYSVVGLVEHMELSLLLMETLVPRFMEGALQMYENIRQHEHMAVNVNQQKPKVSLHIREILLRRMSQDYDFYSFLEQRLFQQKKNFLSKK